MHDDESVLKMIHLLYTQHEQQMGIAKKKTIPKSQNKKLTMHVASKYSFGKSFSVNIDDKNGNATEPNGTVRQWSERM